MIVAMILNIAIDALAINYSSTTYPFRRSGARIAGLPAGER